MVSDFKIFQQKCKIKDGLVVFFRHGISYSTANVYRLQPRNLTPLYGSPKTKKLLKRRSSSRKQKFKISLNKTVTVRLMITTSHKHRPPIQTNIMMVLQHHFH